MSQFAEWRSEFRKTVPGRSLALVLTCLFHALLLTVLLWQWRVQSAFPPLPPITVVPLKAVEATPVEQPKPRIQPSPAMPSTPPEQQQSRTIQTPLPAPLLTLRRPLELSAPAVAIEPRPLPIPSEETAPPPSPRLRKGEVSFEGLLLARIEEMRRYPESALSRRQQGVVQLLFRMNRKGEVLFARVTGGSGFAVLDSEALKMVQRAVPLPKIPPERPDEIEVAVPIEFSLNQQKRLARAN